MNAKKKEEKKKKRFANERVAELASCNWSTKVAANEACNARTLSVRAGCPNLYSVLMQGLGP